MRLDLGCGRTPREGYEGVDIIKLDGVTHVQDLFRPYWQKFKSNSVEAIHCSHLVEHVPNLVGFANELWRICEPDAEVVIQHPYEFSHRAWRDPTHIRCLNEESWLYWDANWRASVGIDHYPMNCDFEIVDIQALASPEYQDRKPEELADLCRKFLNVIDDLVVTLKARK
jgi:predicted SAM-dependent methyltransferase